MFEYEFENMFEQEFENMFEQEFENMFESEDIFEYEFENIHTGPGLHASKQQGKEPIWKNMKQQSL